MKSSKKNITLSSGDPAFSFRNLAKIAFRQGLATIHNYHTSDIHQEFIPTLIESIDAIIPYLKNRGILPHDNLSAKDLPSSLLLLGSGTTEGFDYVVRLLINDVIQENCKKDRHIDPVMVVPVPNYGFFIQQAERWGLNHVPIRSGPGASGITIQQLRDIFNALEKQNKRIVAYYDSNPQNPLGTIRNEEQTKEISKVLLEFNAIYRERDLDEYHTTQSNGNHEEWNGPASQIHIIDDLVYDGLEFNPERHAFGFAQIEEHRGNVSTLLGLSKIGLAGLRAGLLLSTPTIIENCYRLQTIGSYFPNIPAIKAIEEYYRFHPRAEKMRKAHLASLARVHQFRGKFMKSLIDGFDSIPGLHHAEKIEMTRLVSKESKISTQEANKNLTEGIPLIKVLTKPQAGFFHLLDFSAFRGKFFHSNTGKVLGPILSESELAEILKEYKIDVCYGTWMGLNSGELIERVSFAVKTNIIVSAVQRLRELTTKIFEI